MTDRNIELTRRKRLAGTGAVGSFTPVTSAEPGAIGAELTGESPSNTFAGVIDDVRVYDRALSQSEVSTPYDDTK